MKKKKKVKKIKTGKKRVLKNSDEEATALQKAKRLSGEFMSKYDWLMRDKTKGWSGAANQFLRKTYEELFGVKKPLDIPIEIAKACVGYELMARGYKEYGVEKYLPRDFKRNRKAAMKNNLNGFSPELRELIRLSMLKDEVKIKSGDGKPKVVKVKKPRKESPHGFAAEILWNNSKTKYTDEQIQKMILEKFKKVSPSYKRVSIIRVIRKSVNTGLIKKFGKPKKEIKEY